MTAHNDDSAAAAGGAAEGLRTCIRRARGQVACTSVGVSQHGTSIGQARTNHCKHKVRVSKL
jgi:hypothetical protein